MSRVEKVMNILKFDINHLTLDEIAELAGHILTYSNYRLDPARMNHFMRGVDMTDLMEGFGSCQPHTQSESISQSQLFSPLQDAQDDTSTPNVG
ncbi:MAG: hypothetical protein QQN63_08440 [Nitrosopumilus sp.]